MKVKQQPLHKAINAYYRDDATHYLVYQPHTSNIKSRAKFVDDISDSKPPQQGASNNKDIALDYKYEFIIFNFGV